MPKITGDDWRKFRDDELKAWGPSGNMEIPRPPAPPNPNDETLMRVKAAIVASARDCGVSFSGAETVAKAAMAAMREPPQVTK